MSVFIIQEQMRWDTNSSKFVSKFDIESAKRFGKIEHLLSPKAAPFNSTPIISELHKKLKKFSDDDYLLLIGNPCLIGWAVAIAADYNDGRVKLLQWSGKDQKYMEIKADIFADSQQAFLS